MVEREGVVFSLTAKRGESVELDIALAVSEQIASGVGIVALTGLYLYLKKRKKKVDERGPRTKGHLDIIRTSPQMRKVAGEFDDEEFRIP
jgi:hypothetical protein